MMNIKFPQNLKEYVANKNTAKNQAIQPLDLGDNADRVTLSVMLDMELEPLVKAFYPDGRNTTFSQRSMMRCLQTCALQLTDMDENLYVNALR